MATGNFTQSAILLHFFSHLRLQPTSSDLTASVFSAEQVSHWGNSSVVLDAEEGYPDDECSPLESYYWQVGRSQQSFSILSQIASASDSVAGESSAVMTQRSMPGREEDMMTESESASSANTRQQWSVYVRLIAAWLMTVFVLPYAWGRTVLIWMSDAGAPELEFVLLLLASLVVLTALTYELGDRFQQRRTRHQILIVALASFLAANTGLILSKSGGPMPLTEVMAGYLPATLWVVWTGWMSFLTLRWQTKLGLLAIAAVGLLLFISLFRVEGLTGASNILFTRRSESTPVHSEFAQLPDANQTVPAIYLTLGTGDSPQFLGPNRNAVIPDVKLARDWSARPPKLLWRKPVGLGWSGFAIVGDYALTQEQRGEYECVVCYETATGTEVWIHRDKTVFLSSMGGPGPRATPTVNGERVYTLGATGVLNCLEGSNGALVWSVNIQQDAQADKIAHGVCASPLVTEQWVIVCPTGAGGPSLVAYDRDNGKHVWSGGTWRASYSSPIPTEIDGVKQILNFTSRGLVGHNFSDGKVLWSFPWSNNQSINVAQPITQAGGPNRVLIGSGYSKGSALLDIHRHDGSWDATPIWMSRHMKTKFTTAVIHGDHIYGLDDGILECVSLETGKRTWKRGRYGHGQILLADDLIVVQTEKGAVVLLKPDPQKLIELGRLPALSSKTWNIPAISQSKLLVRNDREAACYELHAPQ